MTNDLLWKENEIKNGKPFIEWHTLLFNHVGIQLIPGLVIFLNNNFIGMNPNIISSHSMTNFSCKE